MNKVNQLISALIKETETHISLRLAKDIFLKERKHRVREESYLYYMRHLDHIIDYMDAMNVVSSADLNTLALNSYIDDCKITGHKNNTINKRLEALRMCLNYCRRMEYITKNPLEFFQNLPKDDVETKIIPKVYMMQIMNYVDELPKDNVYNLRIKAMIYLLIDTAVRLKELRYIDLKNINFEDNSIYLTQTKTKKNRTVYFCDKTKQALKEYIKFSGVEQYLMVTEGTNNVISPQNMAKALNKIKRKLSIPSEVSISFHKFRHTCATMLLESGASIVYIQKLLGHSTLQQTQKYMHLSHEVNIETHRVHSPVLSL